MANRKARYDAFPYSRSERQRVPPYSHRTDAAIIHPDSACFFAVTASSSARSFPLLCAPAVLECPLTFFHRTSWWRAAALRSLSHRSLFATGLLRWLSQPFFRHFSCQPLLMQLTR